MVCGLWWSSDLDVEDPQVGDEVPARRAVAVVDPLAFRCLVVDAQDKLISVEAAQEVVLLLAPRLGQNGVDCGANVAVCVVYHGGRVQHHVFLASLWIFYPVAG